MKTRLILFLPLLWSLGAAQAQNLSPTAQALLLDKKIINAIEAGDHPAAADLFARRKEVEVAVSPAMQIAMARVYYALGDYLAAHARLTEYLNAAAPDSPHYDAALSMYIELEAKPEYLAQKEKWAEREILRWRKFIGCDVCPEMVVVPAGSFMMGSPSSEAGRDDNEGPVHRVRIARPFAVGVYEVTRGEYARFVAATGHRHGDSCWTYEGGEWEERSGRNWRRPGFSQTDRDPVVCVNWSDARAYTRWLSGETGEAYRLLSESEWEYAARAGTTTPFHTGRTISTEQANYDGDYTYGSGVTGVYRGRTVAAGSFSPNAFGLHDMHGNVWEWVQDCWNDSYRGAPNDGSVWQSGDCRRRVLRGGSWDYLPRILRSANRLRYSTGVRYYDAGFRVARTLTP